MGKREGGKDSSKFVKYYVIYHCLVKIDARIDAFIFEFISFSFSRVDPFDLDTRRERRRSSSGNVLFLERITKREGGGRGKKGKGVKDKRERAKRIDEDPS